MIDIKAKLDEAKAAKIKTHAVHANRASELGHPCVRYLVYSRTRWQDRLPYDVGLQYIFDEGVRHEKAVIDDLNEAGIRIIKQQKDLEWKKYNITGHIDGRIDDPPLDPPCEIKGISPFEFPKLNTIEDFHRSKKVWIRKIPAQINLYLLLENVDVGVLLIKNKLTAEIKPIWVRLDYEYAETLIRKAEIIEHHIKEGTLPDRVADDSLHQNCAFYHICLPSQINVDQRIENDDLESMVDRYMELKGALKPMIKEMEEAEEAVKAYFNERERAIIGDWQITGKWIDRKAFSVKAKRYWKMEINSLLKVAKIESEE